MNLTLNLPPDIEHQDIDIAPGGEHVVEAAVADIISPAVAAYHPN